MSRAKGLMLWPMCAKGRLRPHAERDATRRLGAALALGKLARHVRAHSLILSRFGLHLLQSFTTSRLETSSSGGPGAAATRAASAAADRLAEGIRHHVARKRDDAKLMDATSIGAPPHQLAFYATSSWRVRPTPTTLAEGGRGTRWRS